MAIGTVPLESLVICAADGKVIRDRGRVRSPRGLRSVGHLAMRRDATPQIRKLFPTSTKAASHTLGDYCSTFVT